MGVVSLWLIAYSGITYFTVYAMQRFAAGPTAVMWYTIAMARGTGIGGLACGQLAERSGYIRVFQLGLGATATAMAAAFFAPQAWWMYLVFALAGTGVCAGMVAIVNLPMELAEQEHVPTYVGVGSLVRAPTGTLAPLAAGYYLEHFAYPPFFLFCGLVSLLAVVVLSRYVKEPRQDDRR